MAKLPKWFGRRRRASASLPDRELAAAFRSALMAVLDGNYDRAEELITRAVRADSEDVEPYRSLARLYRLRGELGRAIQIHQNLLLRRNLDEEQRNAVLGELAADFRQGGFVQRAIASYQEVLARDPRDRKALRALSELLAGVHDYPQALEVFRRLGKIERRKDPEGEARLLTQMAQSAHASGDHDLARKSLKRALRRHASHADARILQGELEAERGRNKAALAAWRLVLEAGGAPAVELHPRVEASFAALGRLEEYERFLRSLLEERPGDAAARMALAGALGTRGEFDAAVLELRRVLDVDPQNLAARIALGRLLIAESRDADAIKEYRELLEWLDRRAVRISQLRELDGLPAGRLDR